MSKNGEQTLSVRERFFKQIEDKQETVDVHAPSGAVYKFRKPSRFGILFNVGQLPQTAASEAAEAWRDQGLIKEDEEMAVQPFSDDEKIKTAFRVRDKFLALSVEPKIVTDPTNKDDEVWFEELPPGDLDFLFQWVATGGNTSAMLGTFPEGPKPDTLASASRVSGRNKAKSVGGDS